MPEQKCLFLFELDPNACENKRQSRKTACITPGYGCPKKHQKHRSVDRVPDKGIRSSPNEFVILFESNCTAPVGAKSGSSPQSQYQTQYRQHESGDEYGR